MGYSIVSTTERSLTLTAGSSQVHITGNDWAEINMTAHIIGNLLDAQKNMKELRNKLDKINSVMSQVSKELEDAESLLKQCK